MIYPHPLPYIGSRVRNRPSGEKSRAAQSTFKFRWKATLAWMLLVTLMTASVLVLAFTMLVVRLRPSLPTAMQIALYSPPVGTNIYSSDGELLATLQLENRKVVPLKEVSPDFVGAILAVEDDRFYKHGAVDPKGLARAAWSNLLSGNSVGQGGSTITMQLARNVPAFGLGREKRLARKLREIMTAVRIEQVFSKDEVLELYLNQIYFGSGAYGVEAASRAFYGKPASKLTLAEAALIAGLPRRPEYYSPVAHPDHAKKRRDVVLARMLKTGRITRSQYTAALAVPVKIRRPEALRTVYKAPYFVDWVVKDLVKRYGVDTVYSGMKVVTTLDWGMQQAAEKALRRGLSHGATQGGIVCLDPHTGEVRAMVGGLDYRKDRFNAMTQGRRQPGSAFKPIVYAAAFDSGTVMLNDEVTDDPISAKSGRKMWTVHNYGGSYSNSTMTVRHAIAQSVNTVAVKVANDTGIDRVVQYAHSLGISSPMAPYLSLALGSSAVRPIELCAAYGHFANEGPRYEPTGLKVVEDRRGRRLDIPGPDARRHESPLQSSTISEMNVALRTVVTEGTGYAAAAVPNAFGKTGTTSDHRDAWFVGYTPELLTTVWVASPHRDKHGVLRYRQMDGGTGGHVAAPIWARFMKTAVPLQAKANRLRRLGPYAIHLPPPDPIAEDELDVSRLAKDEEAERQREIASWFASSRRGDESLGAASREETWANGGRVTVFRPTQSSRRISNSNEEGRSERALAVVGPSGSVSVCADSGLLANRWCPSTFNEDPALGDVPTTHCRMHSAPSGEE
jgi:1A family penicillin-binding protein